MVDKGEGGHRKAAVLLVSLEHEAAARLIAQLEKPEQEKVAVEIVRLEGNPPSREECERVLREFYQTAVAPPLSPMPRTTVAISLSVALGLMLFRTAEKASRCSSMSRRCECLIGPNTMGCDI